MEIRPRNAINSSEYWQVGTNLLPVSRLFHCSGRPTKPQICIFSFQHGWFTGCIHGQVDFSSFFDISYGSELLFIPHSFQHQMRGSEIQRKHSLSIWLCGTNSDALTLFTFRPKAVFTANDFSAFFVHALNLTLPYEIICLPNCIVILTSKLHGSWTLKVMFRLFMRHWGCLNKAWFPNDNEKCYFRAPSQKEQQEIFLHESQVVKI